MTPLCLVLIGELGRIVLRACSGGTVHTGVRKLQFVRCGRSHWFARVFRTRVQFSSIYVMRTKFNVYTDRGASLPFSSGGNSPYPTASPEFSSGGDEFKVKKVNYSENTHDFDRHSPVFSPLFHGILFFSVYPCPQCPEQNAFFHVYDGGQLFLFCSCCP